MLAMIFLVYSGLYYPCAHITSVWVPHLAAPKVHHLCKKPNPHYLKATYKELPGDSLYLCHDTPNAYGLTAITVMLFLIMSWSNCILLFFKHHNAYMQRMALITFLTVAQLPCIV